MKRLALILALVLLPSIAQAQAIFGGGGSGGASSSSTLQTTKLCVGATNPCTLPTNAGDAYFGGQVLINSPNNASSYAGLILREQNNSGDPNQIIQISTAGTGLGDCGAGAGTCPVITAMGIGGIETGNLLVSGTYVGTVNSSGQLTHTNHGLPVPNVQNQLAITTDVSLAEQMQTGTGTDAQAFEMDNGSDSVFRWGRSDSGATLWSAIPYITGCTESSTTATCTTNAVHGLVTGDVVWVQGVHAATGSPYGYNGKFTVASTPTTSSFTYTTVSGMGAGAAGGAFDAALYRLQKNVLKTDSNVVVGGRLAALVSGASYADIASTTNPGAVISQTSTSGNTQGIYYFGDPAITSAQLDWNASVANQYRALNWPFGVSNNKGFKQDNKVAASANVFNLDNTGTKGVGNFGDASNIDSIDIKNAVTIDDLATTGAATGKTMVCADTNGKLYRSSSATNCLN